MIKLTFTVLICLSVNTVCAHPGGHFHKGDVLNNWTLLNGQIVKGNFLKNNGDQIVLEQLGGKLIYIPVKSLSEQDQLLARFKINKFKKINKEINPAFNKSDETLLAYNPQPIIITFLLSLLLILLIFNGYMIIKKNNNYIITGWKLTFSLVTVISLIIACKKSSDATIAVTTTTTTIPVTRLTFLDSAFDPYRPAVTTASGNTYYTIASNGLPAHNMMVGITNWQQQVPAPQYYTGNNSWSIPLHPVYATTPLSTKSNFMKGAVALAVNGIPIFNALNNRGEDSYIIGELDNWGGHCGKGDDYHYHAAPLHLSTTSGLKPIAFALDGFAVYGTTEPDGTTMTTLDTCHGHIYKTSTYHYHGTGNYPYVIGAMRGIVNTDPSTAAPENQILPQAFSSPFRPATTPLNGAIITSFSLTGTNAYSLQYKIGTNFGYVNYSWNSSNKYFFTFISPSNAISTAEYQR